jgi:hypothetical protein
MSQTRTPATPWFDEDTLRKKYPSLVPTNLTGAYHIPAPPRDFNAATASEAERHAHGIFLEPPRDNATPAERNLWKMFLRQDVERIVPQLDPQPGTHHIHRGVARKTDEGTFVSGNWAGSVLAGGTWSSIGGVWSIPFVSEPSEQAGAGGGWHSATWVGIDGWNAPGISSNDVVQIGVNQNVAANGRTSYYAWYEWFAPPEAASPPYIYQTNISNFPVAPGETVTGVVFLIRQPEFGLATGVLILHNMATNQQIAIMLFAPPGANASGNSAEWIVEAYSIGNVITSLAKFTPVTFTGTANNSVDVVQGDQVLLEDSAGKILTSDQVGADSVTVSFVG